MIGVDAVVLEGTSGKRVKSEGVCDGLESVFSVYVDFGLFNLDGNV